MFKWLSHLFETKEERKARLKAEAAAQAEQERLEALAEKQREEAERVARRAEEVRERAEQALEKAKEKKARKEVADKIKKAKAFVKAKGLRRTRRNGETVYVNSDNDIVNYAILYYLLFHTNNETYGRDSNYHDDHRDTTGTVHLESDYSGFGGGSSGGGGASSSWDDSSSSGSSFDSFDSFGGFGGGDSGGGGASGSW